MGGVQSVRVWEPLPEMETLPLRVIACYHNLLNFSRRGIACLKVRAIILGNSDCVSYQAVLRGMADGSIVLSFSLDLSCWSLVCSCHVIQYFKGWGEVLQDL